MKETQWSGFVRKASARNTGNLLDTVTVVAGFLEVPLSGALGEPEWLRGWDGDRADHGPEHPSDDSPRTWATVALTLKRPRCRARGAILSIIAHAEDPRSYTMLTANSRVKGDCESSRHRLERNVAAALVRFLRNVNR